MAWGVLGRIRWRGVLLTLIALLFPPEFHGNVAGDYRKHSDEEPEASALPEHGHDDLYLENDLGGLDLNDVSDIDVNDDVSHVDLNDVSDVAVHFDGSYTRVGV